MINFMVPTITGDEVNQQFSDGMATVFSGVWDIIAPFAGAAVVLFAIFIVVRNVVASKTRR